MTAEPNFEIDDPMSELYELDDDLAEVDQLRSIILDSVCHAVQHGFWHFAFYQSRGWWNIFDALHVMYRHAPVSVDELLAGMQEGYRKYSSVKSTLVITYMQPCAACLPEPHNRSKCIWPAAWHLISTFFG